MSTESRVPVNDVKEEKDVGLRWLGYIAVVTGAVILGYGLIGDPFIRALDHQLGWSLRTSATAKRLQDRLPRTKITSVDCRSIAGLCEVVAGQNLFYTDRQARYLMIGRVYDLETRADLTAARLLELAPDTLARGAPKVPGLADQSQAARVDVALLPKDGAVAWGPRDGPRVVVFSDLACPYCRMLHQALRQIGARVEEYPIAILGSRPLAQQVLCADNPAEALAAVYGGDRAGEKQRPDCNTRLLEANEAFFHARGWRGTPILVRTDGQVHEGALSAEGLKAWLAGGRA